jgi:general stress protein 26
MNSIDGNQIEHNYKDLNGVAAVDKIKNIIDKVGSCFFSTTIAVSGSSGTRPMRVQRADDDGNLWFLSANDSHKDQELR